MAIITIIISLTNIITISYHCILTDVKLPIDNFNRYLRQIIDGY